MTFKIATDTRNKACDAIVDDVDAGAAAGYVEIRTGAPSGPNAADSGILLATLPMSDPAFGAAVAGVATANAITNDSSADATGTAAHFRLKDSDANIVGEGTVTATGGGGDMELNSVSIIIAAVVSITSLTVTVPES